MTVPDYQLIAEVMPSLLLLLLLLLLLPRLLLLLLLCGGYAGAVPAHRDDSA
jgi:hypothetical protein